MNLLPQVSKKNRLAFLLAVGLLVLLIAGGLLWHTQHQSDSFDALIQKMAFDTLKDDPEKQLYFGLNNVEGIRWDPTKLTDLSDADYKQLNEKRNGYLQKLNEYDAAKLSPEDKLTYDILKWNLSYSKPEETILYRLFAEKLTELKLDPSEEEKLTKELVQTLTDHVLPSYGKLADVINNDLMKQASVSQGIWSQPGGSEYYSASLKLKTGTDLSPQEMHEIAKRRVEEIVKKLRSGASGQSQTTSATRFLTGDELLQVLNRSLSDATPYLSDWFEEELIPDHPVDVRAYSALMASAGGMYIPLSIDGDRSGRFVIPLENPPPEEWAKMLALHEGIPGHHFQFSIQYDQPRHFIPFFFEKVICHFRYWSSK